MTARRASGGGSTADVVAAIAAAALSYPGAVEEFPWGERVAKVNKKIFCFIGGGVDDPRITVKIPDDAPAALALDACEPTAYGLGKAGWVTVHLDHTDAPGLDVMLDWVDESYRAVAPKRLVAELDAQGGPTIAT